MRIRDRVKNFFRSDDEMMKMGSVIANAEFFETLCTGEYTSLADSPEILSAVKAISRLVSSMTIQLMENTENGDQRVKNELSRKIDISPYSLANRKVFIEYLVKQLILNGNALVVPQYKGYSKEGNPMLADLVPLNVKSYQFIETKKGYIVKGEREYNQDSVLNFVLNPKDDAIWEGEGYKATLKEVAKNLKQARKTTNAFMTTNFMPSVIVKVDSNNDELLSPEGRKKLQERLLPSSRGEPVIIPDDIVGLEVIKPLTLKDIAIHESVEIDKKAVANLIGVPPFLLGVGEFKQDTFNNFVSTTVREIAQIIEQELTNKLLISDDMYFRMSIRSLYSYSLTDLISAGAVMVQNAAMYRNEWRDWAGLEYKEEMEELILLENFIPADRLGDQEKLKGNGAEKNPLASEKDIETSPNIEIEEDETISQVSLNGAQISGLIQIVESVISGVLEYEAAITLITSAFPFDAPTAKKIVGNKIAEKKGEEDE